MQNIFYFIIIIISTSIFSAQAQLNTQIRDFYLNRDEEGAQYEFTFAHITDIHIGEGEGDYGSPGYLDDVKPEGDKGFAAVRLRKIVNWINDNAAAKNIHFVLVTGDITDSGERSEFEKAKEILDDLKIPYVPTIGNHDIWPYVRYQDEAPYAYGDSVMLDVFKDTYQKAKNFFDTWDEGTMNSKIYNPESKQEHYHQNFAFTYKGFGFIAMDLNPRYHVRKAEPGIGAEARLNDFPGGTYPWLLQTIQNHPIKNKKNLILLSHQPPHRDILALFNGLPLSDHDRMTRDLVEYRQHLGLWLAGHVHRNIVYSIRTIGGGVKVVDVKETAANKEYDEGFVTLVHAYSIPTVTSIRDHEWSNDFEIFPNPSNNSIIIQVASSESFHTLRIFHTSGQLMWEEKVFPKKSIQINLTNWASGQYLIQMVGDDVSHYRNFIKVD